MEELHTKEWYENYANEHNYELTNISDKIIESVKKCDGYCPCRYSLWKKTNPNELEKIKCPCVFIEEDMKDNKGNCHCFLFKKK